MKYTISKEISNRSWSNVDKTVMRNKLVKSLENNDSGVNEAVREIYAVIQSSDLLDSPSTNLKFPHHELSSNGIIKLNRNGVFAAYAALKGARSTPDITSEQMSKAMSHIKGHYKDLNESWPEDKNVKSYVIHLEPEFDENLQSQYISFLNEKGIPNDDLSAAIFDLCRSLPYYNKNYIGIRKEVLEISHLSIMYKMGDLNHRRDLGIGFTLNSELISGQNEEDPVVMRVCAAFWKDRLLAYDISSISSQNGFSMEINVTDWEYLINDVIYTRQEKPGITDEQVDNLIYNGIPIYDSDGNLVILLGGTLENPINFKGFGVIIKDKRPADYKSNVTYLEVASEKNSETNELIEQQTNKEGEVKTMSFKIFETENDYNAEIESIKQEVKNVTKGEYDTIVANLNKDLETINANFITKDTELNDLKIKASDFEVKYNSEKERASGFESKLKTIESDRRKQVLASKNLGSDMITKKLSFIESASDNEFNDYVAELDIYASLYSTPVVRDVKEVVASEKESNIDLIKDVMLTDNGKDENKDTIGIDLFV